MSATPRRPGRRGRWLGHAVFIGACLTAALSLGPVATAQASSPTPAASSATTLAAAVQPGPVTADVPTYFPPPDNVWRGVPGSHRCSVFGTDEFGNQAVHCAEILARFATGPGEVQVQGQNELICENSDNDIVECAGIKETVSLCFSDSDPTPCIPGNSGICGKRYGHNPCGIRRVTNQSDTVGNVCHEVWGESLNDVIALPRSGKTVGGDGNNQSSNHFVIC